MQRPITGGATCASARARRRMETSPVPIGLEAHIRELAPVRRCRAWTLPIVSIRARPSWPTRPGTSTLRPAARSPRRRAGRAGHARGRAAGAQRRLVPAGRRRFAGNRRAAGCRGARAGGRPDVDELSREQEVHLMGAPHGVAAAFARCARQCREGRTAAGPLVAHRAAVGPGGARGHDSQLTWFDSREPPPQRVAERLRTSWSRPPLAGPVTRRPATSLAHLAAGIRARSPARRAPIRSIATS